MPADHLAHGSEGGFTLLEIMVGLLISALIMVSLSMAVRGINRGFDQAAALLGRQDSIATGLHVFAEDIARIERPTDSAATPGRFLFTGRPDEIIYVLAERPGNNPAGLYWVRLLVRVADGLTELTRMRAPFTLASADAGALPWSDEVVLFRGKAQIEFAYRAPRAKLRSWANSWAASSMLPGQIKIEITDTATERLLVPGFVATLKIGAETACATAEAPGCTMKSEGVLAAQEARQ